jgi:rRNA maturation endonuclease Nob1
MTKKKTYWFIECKKCTARFTTKIWEIENKGFCPSCGETHPNNATQYKFLEKYTML